MRKKEIYAAYGIDYKKGKIFVPGFGWLAPLLKNGNSKLGRGVWTWSTLAGTCDYAVTIDGKAYTVRGTCACDCKGCYAKNGCYCFSGVRAALAIRTILARENVEFLNRAIRAQIEADKIEMLRIHAAGDFIPGAYSEMWRGIAADFSGVKFWTYTKVETCEKLFDGLSNANIVKSLVPNCGLNYGTADYLLRAYNAAKSTGASVHICKCGVDPDQHCTNCAGCSKNDYVLFLEHGTAYKPEFDPAFEAFKALVESQPDA